MTSRALKGAAALAACAVVLPASAAGTASFRTPSGLIYCAYASGPTFLRCDTLYRTRFSGRKRCRVGDYGQAFGMTPRGRARALCASDSTYNPRARVIRYGTVRRFGPYKCRSRRSGLTCKNERGHGWKLSRRHQKLF